MLIRAVIAVLLAVSAWSTPVWAEGPQFNGSCNLIGWNANTEPDLAGYRLYDRISLTNTPTLRATYGPSITSVTCASLGFNPGQHYVSLRSYDASGNESAPSSDLPFVLISSNLVSDLRVTIVNSTDVTLAFTEVDGGDGLPAKYDVRVATPSIVWGTAASVSAGTCSTPVAGTTIGASKTCTVTGLSTTTLYQFQLIPFRGTPNVDAVYGPLSNIASATTGSPPPSTASRYIIATDPFTRADSGDLGIDWTPYTSQPWSIIGNLLQTPSAAPVTSRERHAAVLPNRQWACVRLTTIAGTEDIWAGVLLRVSDSSDTGYQFLASRNTASSSLIERRVAGSTTTLTTDNSITWANGDELCGEADDTVLRLYRNGAKLLEMTDATIASGFGGLFGYLDAGANSNLQLDTYSAGGFDDRVTLATDAFTRSNGPLGPEWLGGYTGRTSAVIASNAVQAGSLKSETQDTYSPVVLPDDHWAEIDITTLNASGGWNAAILYLRAAAPPSSQKYSVVITNQSGLFSTTIYGPSGMIAQVSLPWVSGDVLRAEVRGATIRVYRNNLLVLTAINTEVPTGSRTGIGVYADSALGNVVLDNFKTGSFGALVADLCGCDQH